MKTKISAIVNTYNEEENIQKCLDSLTWVDEIVVVDMYSSDKTVEICKTYTDKVHFFKNVGYVEPARNFGINNADGEWIIILDADERIPEGLRKKIIEMVEKDEFDYIVLPWKSFIFGKWIQYTGWNYESHIRLFRKGYVTWSDEVHSLPECTGREFRLVPQSENEYIIHYNHASISQFMEKINRYTTAEASNLIKKGEIFTLEALIRKPFLEFQRRFFAYKGYKDNLHGVGLSGLLNFYWFITYLKLWEQTKGQFASLDEKQIVNRVGEYTSQNFFEFLYSWHNYKKTALIKRIILGMIRRIHRILFKFSKLLLTQG